MYKEYYRLIELNLLHGKEQVLIVASNKPNELTTIYSPYLYKLACQDQS